MSKRGRPPKNGYQPPWMLRRDTFALYGYQQARKAGEKHESAIDCAVAYVQEKMPGVKISKTEVKRAIARLASRESPLSAHVSEPDPANNTITLPNGRRVRIVLTVSVGPRNDYPRHNGVNP